MDKRGLIGLIIVVGVLLVVGFVWFVGELGGDVEEECVKVQTTCCSCNMGGSEKCVLVSEVDEYRKNLFECSDSMLCAAVYNCEIESCEYVDGECVGR